MRTTCLALALCVSALFPGASTAKEAIEATEAASYFSDVCITSAGDKSRMEQVLSEQSDFDFAQSTPSQTVANHKSKDLGFLLITAGAGSSCVMTFQYPGDLLETFYAFRSELAARLDISADAITLQGTAAVYESDQLTLMIRAGSGLRALVNFN